MASVSDRALLATVAADVTLILGYIISAVHPDRRVWPIGDSSWRWWFNWSALSVVFAGFPVLAALDRDSFIVTERWSKLAGSGIAALGMRFALSALFELGWMESSGREGELRTDGIYQYTRNPQSVGFITFIVGAIIAVNSRKLAVHGILTILVYTLFPFAEEPWLREQYGQEYEQYRERTPRFIGRDLVKKLITR
uniref:methyltransferase family protein n=1 Tax=Haloprofundus sp. MHR1 TaxID=2572921 RepID=UPI001F445BDD|nr:methyltransferase [Haloprofundus sp. MHR1]